MLSLTTISLTVVIVAGALTLWLLAPQTFAHLCREDGLVESTQVVLFALSAAMFVYASRGARLGSLWTIGLASLSIWIAGEEVSWGQRMLGVATPEWLTHRNVQQELNIHNLDGIHQHIRAAGLLFFGVIAFAFPLGYRRVTWVTRLVERLDLPIFPLSAAATVAAAIAFQLVPRLRGTVIFGLDEVGELLLAIAFAAFAASQALTSGVHAGATQGAGREHVRGS